MLDDLMKLLGNSTDLAVKFAELEQKTAPIMAQIQNNSEGVDPELLKHYNEQMTTIENGRAELEAAKEKLRKLEAEKMKKK